MASHFNDLFTIGSACPTGWPQRGPGAGWRGFPLACLAAKKPAMRMRVKPATALLLLALLLPTLLAACSDGRSTRDIVGRPRPPAARTQPLPPGPQPASQPPAAPKPRTDWVARRVVPDAVTTPQGRFHVVKSGETGIAIARAYGLRWSDLVALNGLKEPFVLQVGQRLRLSPAPAVVAQRPPAPASTPASAAPQTLEERARAFDISIDDVMTGGQPAAVGSAAPPGEDRPTPLPALTGDAPRFRWPLPGRIISGFGPKPGGRFNDGVNLKASVGEPVRAAGDGVVAYAGDAIAGFGNLILVKHAGGWVSAYGHNEALLVSRGARVKAGEVIARAGQSGAVAEPQLHFELRRGRTPVDPLTIIGGR
jgi:murein DD-endopeptidase MepM/ murein hydrolase activator NlpD